VVLMVRMHSVVVLVVLVVVLMHSVVAARVVVVLMHSVVRCNHVASGCARKGNQVMARKREALRFVDRSVWQLVAASSSALERQTADWRD
jgi:hypothetical protein